MGKYGQPSSLALYLLVSGVFFVAGASVAGLSGVAEGQGLAGGATVLFYGLLAALAGLVGSVLYVARVSRAAIRRAAWAFFGAAVVVGLILAMQVAKRQDHTPSSQPAAPRAPTSIPGGAAVIPLGLEEWQDAEDEPGSGLSHSGFGGADPASLDPKFAGGGHSVGQRRVPSL